MKKGDVQSKLEVIPENIEKLELLAAKDFREFSSDFRNVDSGLHRLQTSIQALIDIGSYIIAELGLRTPTSSTEVIDILAEDGLVDSQHRARYISMIQFRNRVVHVYNSIDIRAVHDILGEGIDDLRTLYRALLETIETHEQT